MGDIQLLTDNIVNKIAAGEVIERPASVVKELIENSIDAGATSVTVEIKDGGKSFISVTDNGWGMKPKNARLSIKRHATSKISGSEDLDSIKSLGFRGEALASIAAVSRVTITTRPPAVTKGTMVKAESSKITEEKVVGCKTGTNITVSELFFNTPARQKYLYSATAEFSHIINFVQRYALLHDNIGFNLINSGKKVFATSPNEKGLANIARIYGVNTAKAMLEVNHQTELFKITGFISKPSLTRATKDQQSFYINGRYIKNKTITQAVHDAYHTLLFLDRNPVVILNIKMDYTLVDVNVHPTKEIVRIDKENELYQAVFEAIQTVLKSNNLMQRVDPNTAFSYTVETLKPQKSRYPLKTDTQSVLDDKFSNKESASPYNRELDTMLSSSGDDHEVVERHHPSGLSTHDDSHHEAAHHDSTPYASTKQDNTSEYSLFYPYRYLGQINLTYVLIETKDGLLIIDQHAAQERVNYERFMKQFYDNAIKKQKLVQPKVLEFSMKDKSVILNNEEILSKIGFEIEEYGHNSFLLRAIPSIFGRYYDHLLPEIIEEISVNRKSMDVAKEEIIIRMACRKSIKAGEELTKDYVKGLLKDLENCEKPYTCPHGRPTIISMTLKQLEKQFKRVA